MAPLPTVAISQRGSSTVPSGPPLWPGPNATESMHTTSNGQPPTAAGADNTSPQPAPDPRTLPIYAHADELLEALATHRVIVVEGPTGCGKTTQLPRILLEAGFGEHGIIGVTQPRRIAAVSVAWRIADELQVPTGDLVGYAIRFDDQTSPATRIKIMTDGLLLQEARGDSDFSAYSVIVVDEAHERSLNIDLTLGLLHRAVQRRDDLRVIVSSATLQPETFEDFFGDLGPVRRISIDVRTHPIDIVYRPPATPDHEDLIDGIADEVHRLHRNGEAGHILCFLPGEGLIKKAQEAIYRRGVGRGLEVMPLFGRLKREEQERVFSDVDGVRKVILATNIAETSITVPGVNHVIDSGLVKIPRYDGRTGITTLREEWISQASAEQRAGRAGRTGPGVCVRLYPAHTMSRRAPFTEEEILRLDLAEVVLRLLDLGIKDIESFPLPTEPPKRKLRGALGTLQGLGAVDRDRNLTDIGAAMVRFPLEPGLSRMVVEAARRFPEAMEEVLTVASWMSVRDPYLFPDGEEVQARKAHDRLASDHGDALTAVQIMRAFRRARDKRRFCKDNYLEHDTLAFVEKAYAQLRDIAEGIGVQVEGGRQLVDIAPAVVRCVAAGHPTNFLRREQRGYVNATGDRAMIHPSSSLFGTRHHFVVAATLFQTRQVYASQVSPVDPEWIVELAPAIAQDWDLGRRRKKQRREEERAAFEQVAASTPPQEQTAILVLGGVQLPLRQRRKSALVEIPLDRVERLRSALERRGHRLLAELPPGADHFRATVVDGGDHWLDELYLPQVLKLLPLLRLPRPDEGPLPDDTVPQGVLLERERNLHTLERFIGHVLEPMRPVRGKKPGWLMLVANGAGGYWFEVTPAFDEAVVQTLDAVDDLLGETHETDALYDRLVELANGLRELRDQVRIAMRRPNKGR